MAHPPTTDSTNRYLADGPRSSARLLVPALVVPLLILAFAACGSDDGPDDSDGSGGEETVGQSDEQQSDEQQSDEQQSDGQQSSQELYPDVVEVELTPLEGQSYEVSTTLSSPYDSPERYADAWRVLGPDGDELGIRELGHDHADEQPFTRSTEVEIPPGVQEVTVEGRDQVSGWGGATVTVEVPG